MRSFTFRMSEGGERILDEIVNAMQESTSVDLSASTVLRMLIREEGLRRRTYGPHLLGDVVCGRNEDGRAVVTGVRHDWVLSSPSGLEWGYVGLGPRDLALNVLLKATGDRDFAARHRARFCMDVAAQIPHSGGTMQSKDVLEWVARFRDDDRARGAVSGQ